MNKLFIIGLIFFMVGCAKHYDELSDQDILPDFDKLWNYNDPGQTEQEFRKLLSQTEKSGDTSYHARLLTQIARTEGLQGRYEDAHRTLDTVESMLTDDLVVARIRYLLERGRVFNSSGDPEKSRTFFIDAWKKSLAAREDFYAVDAAHMMAIVEPVEQQLLWSGKAMEVAEKTDDERARKWLGPLYNNTGWTYHDMGEYEKALELFKKSLEFRIEKKDEQGRRIAEWTIARVYRSLNRIEEAVSILEKLDREISEQELDPDGYVFEELGECLLLQNENEKAKKYFKLAYDIISKDDWMVKNESERLERLKRLSE